MHDQMPDDNLRSIAVDLSVNNYIPGIEKWEWPAACCVEAFPGLKLEKFKGAKFYYDQLELAKQKKQKSAQKGEPNGDGEPGKGTTGDKMMDRMIEGGGDGHKQWKAIPRMSEAQQKLVQKQMETQIKQAAEDTKKNRGNTPAELDEILKKLFEEKPPVIDWRGYLRRFAGNNRSQEIKRTRKKENIKFPHSPAIKAKRKVRIAMCIDQSGSMGERDLAEINNEMHHQWKAGAEIDVVSWD